jgi:hypothetical protein
VARALWWIVALMIMSACTAPASPRVAPRIAPAPPPAPEPSPKPVRNAFPAGSHGDTGSEGEMLLRLDVEPTFRLVVRCGAGGMPHSQAVVQPFGHVPKFTLYEDGSVVFVRDDRERERVLRAQIGREGAQAFMDELERAGLQRVQTYTEDCSPRDAQGEQFCIADAGITVLDVRMPSGERRVIRNYAGMAKDQKQQEALKTILKRLRDFAHTSERDYLPTHATLLITRCDEAKAEWSRWPLAPGLLDPPAAELQEWAVRVPGDAYDALYGGGAAVGSVVGFRHAGRGYAAFLVPVLPGADISAIERYRER